MGLYVPPSGGDRYFALPILSVFPKSWLEIMLEWFELANLNRGYEINQ
ncbi:hypothetical protein IQ268_04865 [Oculatella sp. LEGE 06141]|nr:hypothetical protein [Oculatella sp. LEGE 06141]MBE9177914.1 hypothetical protein [Oculatella sp. LEGE 06141]